MEAATLKKKKNTMNKTKMKKTIKNILCRPDQIVWFSATNELCKQVEEILDKYKVEVPVFIKPQWSELKNIPKAERPKAPAVKKVDGLIFGISHCARLITSGECIAILLDNEIKPKILVQHIVEACEAVGIPFICINNLKKVTLRNFGISTCCLGVRKGKMEELLIEIRKGIQSKNIGTANSNEKIISQDVEMDLIDGSKETHTETNIENEIPFSYLYRTSKATRVFVPHSIEGECQQTKTFTGQEFIEVSNKTKDLPEDNFYKRMYVKRVMNNPNRPERNKKQKS